MPTFTFLTIFDVNSDAERKNPLCTVRAFIDAFKGVPDIHLIIKVRNLNYDAFLTDKLQTVIRENPNIELVEGDLDEEGLDTLYKQADVYVSLHRAEGFGLTISDAMSRGIPVIATGYSGNMDFCDISDTRLVAYDLRPVGHDRPRYRADDVWAEPRLEDAVRAFKELVHDYPVWLEKAAHARARAARDFSMNAVASLIKERLGLISGNFNFPDDMTNRHIDVEVGIVETYGL